MNDGKIVREIAFEMWRKEGAPNEVDDIPEGCREGRNLEFALRFRPAIRNRKIVTEPRAELANIVIGFAMLGCQFDLNAVREICGAIRKPDIVNDRGQLGRRNHPNIRIDVQSEQPLWNMTFETNVPSIAVEAGV
jgi:hypothetical protein